MNMSLTTTSSLPPQIQQSVDDVLLSVNQPTLIMALAAFRKRLANKGGDTLRMSRYERLPAAPVPLGNTGATPPAANLNRTDIDCRVSYYGLYVAINQQVVLQNQDQVLNETAELLGLSLRMTEDQLIRDALASSASFYNCTGGSNGDLPSNISLEDCAEVVSILMQNNAYMVLDRQIGEDRFGTGPVRNAFVTLSPTALSRDLDALNGFLPQWNYPLGNPRTLSSEWGAVNNMRFFISSVGSISPNASALGNNVLNNFTCGMESYATVEQDNFAAQVLYRSPQFSDPLFQNVTLGYVMSQGVRILNELWLLNMRCTLR